MEERVDRHERRHDQQQRRITTHIYDFLGRKRWQIPDQSRSPEVNGQYEDFERSGQGAPTSTEDRSDRRERERERERVRQCLRAPHLCSHRFREER